jgi:hypothetical protein
VSEQTVKPRVHWSHVLRSNWRGLSFVRADELDAPQSARDHELDEESEAQYRRGYMHGYSKAMDDMLLCSRREYSRVRECYNWLAFFYDTALARWAHARRPQYAEPPQFSAPPKWSEQRAKVQQRDSRCVACGSGDRLECDHITPVAEGGRAEVENLRLLCFHCHRGGRRTA